MQRNTVCMILGWSLWILWFGLLVVWYRELHLIEMSTTTSATGMGATFSALASQYRLLDLVVSLLVVGISIATMIVFHQHHFSMIGPTMIFWGGFFWAWNPLCGFLASLFWIPVGLIGMIVLTVSNVRASHKQMDLDFKE